MKQPNILHLVNTYTTGGAETVLNNLCALGSNDVENTIFSFNPSQLDAPQKKDRPIKLVDYRKRKGNDYRIIFAISDTLRSCKADICHAQGWGTYIEGLLATKCLYRKAKFIFAFHGKTIEDTQLGIPWRRRLAQKIAFIFSDAVIAPSRNMAEDYAKTFHVSKSRIRVIYNGVNISHFSYGENSIRNKLGFSEKDFVVGFVGRLDPVKNLRGLLIAFKHFLDLIRSRDRRHIYLLIVGDGPEGDNLKKEAEKLLLNGHVIFWGSTNEVAACLRAMDVYFQPSFYEGHSMTILEAMATGLPVISSEVGGTPEIIQDGKTGFLCNPADYQSQANFLNHLYTDSNLRKSIGGEALQTVREKFTVQKMVFEYEKLYSDLLRQDHL